MKLFTEPEQLAALVAQGAAVTIGNFDGVHRGHQALLGKTVEQARRLGVPSVAITFEPHPLQLLMGHNAPPILMPLETKIEHITATGIDAVLVLSFTHERAALSPEEFVQSLLVDVLHTRFLAIGYDYAFGKGRRGNAALLTALGKTHGFVVEQIQAVSIEGVVASSTSIRAAMKEGDVAKAALMLGFPYTIASLVVHGKGRGGKLLGFPTANLVTPKEIFLPREGVYAVQARLIRQASIGPGHSVTGPLQGVASVGTNPTFQDGTLRVEVHLMDFEYDIYGDTLEVAFMDWIRPQQRFSGPEELIAKINQDVVVAKERLEHIALHCSFAECCFIRPAINAKVG